MAMAEFYVILSITVLLLIFVLLFVAAKHRRSQRISPLAATALAFVFISVLFERRLYVYSLIGIGVALALTDIFIQLRKKRRR